MRSTSRVRSFGHRRLGSASLLILPLLLGGCQDRPSPVQPADEPAAAASVVPVTVRTSKGDLITGEAAEFAAALKEIGPDGEVLVWVKETGTPHPAPEFFLNLPSSGKETIALPADVPGARRRTSIGPPSVRGASVDAVVRALGQAGAPSPERMSTLPVIVARLPEQTRLAALQVLLRHPNVDYVSAVRTRPVELVAGPMGANPMDAKHTVHKIPQVWDLTRGSGAKVGILDSGFAREVYSGAFHDDGRNFGSYGIVPLGFIDDLCSSANSGSCSPYDDQYASNGHAHGTAMAGLVGANDNNHGYVGIAPQATTYSMKIAWNTHISGHCGDNPFNDSGYCIEDDDFVRAINWAASQRLHVLSMSFLGNTSSDVYRALSTARNSYGVFLVAGLKNYADQPEGPAHYDIVMGVAGVDAAGNNLFTTASRDVSGFAGGATLSALCYRNYTCDAGSPGRFTEAAGTSAATANVAGIVALIRSYHPHETVTQIWNRLILTAEGPNRVVNAYAAITYQAPLTVGIAGPTEVQPWSYATWTAMAQNGTAPYSYAWYQDDAFVATGDMYSAYVPNGGTSLRVDVTDAAGRTTTGYLWVSATQQCGTQHCVEQPILY